MTWHFVISAVWVGIVFGPSLWQLCSCWRSPRWCYFVLLSVTLVLLCIPYHFVTNFCNEFLWQIFVTNFCDKFLRRIFGTNFSTNFCDEFLWLIFVTNFCDEFLWRIFVTNFFDKLLWRIHFWRFLLTYNLLTNASLRIGVPSILFCGKFRPGRLVETIEYSVPISQRFLVYVSLLHEKFLVWYFWDYANWCVNDIPFNLILVS